MTHFKGLGQIPTMDDVTKGDDWIQPIVALLLIISIAGMMFGLGFGQYLNNPFLGYILFFVSIICFILFSIILKRGYVRAKEHSRKMGLEDKGEDPCCVLLKEV